MTVRVPFMTAAKPAPAAAASDKERIEALLLACQQAHHWLSQPGNTTIKPTAILRALDKAIKLGEGEGAGIWVLTFEVNAYDQEGEYFERAWGNKPTADELLAAGVLPADVDHVLAGGGRRGVEDRWQHLREQTEQPKGEGQC